MKVFTSRVVVCAIMSFVAGTCAYADIPAADYKTLTSKAYVDSMVSDSNVSGNKINGVALSTGGYFYGVEDSNDTGTTATRKVSIPNITELTAGLMIIVKPIVDAAYANNTNAAAAKLQLNNFEAKVMRYNGAVLTTTTDGYAWKNGFPAIWVYDGTYWNYAGGYDANTTYSTMSVSEGRTATATSQRVVTAKKLKGIVHGLTLASVATDETNIPELKLSDYISLNQSISTTDTILSALGKLQGQITNLSSTVSNIPDYGHNLVNGAPIGRESSTFFGYEDGGDPGRDKKVKIESIAQQEDGIIIIVQPNVTSRARETKLQLNDFEPAFMYYQGAPVTEEVAPVVWNNKYPSTWVYNRSIPAWIFAGNGYDAIVEVAQLAQNVSDLNTTVTDLSGHKVNGAPISNANSYFFDSAGGGTASSAAKTASISSIPSTNNATPPTGLIITVRASAESTATTAHTLKLNTFAAKPIYFQGEAVTTQGSKIWTNKYPTTFVFDGTNWVVTAIGYESDTTYTALSWGDTQNTATDNYSITFDGGTGNWPSADSSKMVTGISLAKGLARKQNKISATSSTYTNGSVVTTTSTAGTVGERGIANAPAYNSSNELTNGDYIATISAVNAAANDLSGHKVNGSPLSNTSTVFAGKSHTAAGTGPKQVDVSGINELVDGLMVIITPDATTTVAISTIQINDLTAKPVYYKSKSTVISASQSKAVWLANTPSIWVYDTSANSSNGGWIFAGYGNDNNTTYYAMNALTNPASGAETYGNGIAGTSTYNNVISPRILKNVIHNTNLTANAAITGENLGTFNPTNSAITASDTIIGALGKAQGQINSLSTMIGGLEYLAWDTAQNTATDAYSITFDSSTNNWPETDSGKIVTGLSLAKGLQRKQNRLAATSTGNAAPVTGGGQAFVANTLGSPNTRYIAAGYDEALTAKSGADEVQAYMWGNDISSSNGLTATQVEQSLVSLKTLKGVYDELEGEIPDLSTYKINGVPVSSGGFFWGTSDTAAGTAQKDVTASNIPSTAGQNPPTGIIIAIKPSATSTVANSTIKLNDFNAKAMRRNNAAITTSTDSIVWNQNYPTFWVFDGTYWQYLGGWDQDSTYSTMSVSEGRTATATTQRSMTAAKLKGIVHGLTLTTVAHGESGVAQLSFTPTDSAITASDTIIGAFGKAQGQINSLSTSVSGLEHGIEDNGASNEHIAHDAVPIPDALAYTGLSTLTETDQLFWLPSLDVNGNEAANRLLKSYSLSGRKIVPTMDALAYALDGVVQTRENTREWQNVASYYRLPMRDGFTLAMVAGLIEREDPNAILLNKSGYLQTFAPTLEALMTESYNLRQDLSAYADSTATDAARLRQNKIPNTGYIRTSNTATTATAINNSGTNSWGSANVKGAGLVTKTTTDGVVGERSIIDVDTTTTSWTSDRKNLAIPSMAKVEDYAQKKKVCAEYAPGTTQSNQSAATCWLWTLAD